MSPFFTLKGFYKPDPLDKAPAFMQYLLMTLVTIAVSILLVYAITDVFKLLEFKCFCVKIFEVVIFSLIFAPVIVKLRKSASWVLILIIFIPLFVFDIFLQSNYRDKGITALWTYLPGTFIDNVKILPLRFLMTLSFDALIFGPVCLWLTRIAAQLIYRNRKTEAVPTIEQREALFNEERSLEIIDRPAFDFGFWILRILGYSYLAYLMVLVIGFLGASPWPPEIADLIAMTYKNPALAINTFSKIGMMILLTFIGAYNSRVRFYCCWGLIVGHAASTICSLAFYFYDPPGTEYRDFLLTSAIVDGVMIILFFIILFQSRKNTYELNPEKDFPKYFSIPSQTAKFSYIVIATVSFGLVVAALYFRLFTHGESGAGAVFGYPDPTFGNTVTLYTTVGFISLLLALSEKLRYYLFGVLLFPFFVGVIVAIPMFIVKDLFSDLYFVTRSGKFVLADWYFVVFIAFNVIVWLLMISLRKFYYNIDYTISSINPSSAKCIISLADAFYEGDSKKNTAILQSIDQYVGGIRGRKRGILNFPFWIVESILNLCFALHPNFSVMSREHQRWFLKKYVLRSPAECSKSFIPVLSEFAFQIGLAVNAMVMFANYSNINTRKEIGYTPFYARDRLQGEVPAFDPPFNNAEQLPRDPADKLNNKPVLASPEPFIAPRVTTPVDDPQIPDEVDYLVLGSGAGGAVMAYRLACEVKDPSKILVVERGNRYQPLQDFNDNEMEMMRKLYKEGGLQQTKKFTMSVLQGECVGGTTVINNAICIEMNGKTKNRWENEFDIDLTKLDSEYERIGDEIEIKELAESGINKNVSSKFKKGVEGYNQNTNEKLIEIFPLKSNYRNLVGDENWNLGNKRLTKRTMLETYLPWSEARGVKIVSNTTGLKFIKDRSRAESVLLRLDNGELKKVRVNKAVVVACGVISSSHFLMRSGVEKNVGHSMSCNFAFPVTLQFEDKLKAFDGNQITLGAADQGNRAVFETYFNPPASFALASIPFYFGKRDALMKNYDRLVNFGTLVGSEPNGIIQKKVDLLNGQAFSWELGEKDRENIKFAFTTILKLGYHAGATKAVLPMKPGIEVILNEQSINRFENDFRSYPLRMEDLLIGTAHPQGGNIIVGNNSNHKSKRVLNSDFCVEGTDNVYVADASLFPESMGLNPQWTIMAMSSIASEKVLKHE